VATCVRPPAGCGRAASRAGPSPPRPR
jgi:hypothetical protein